MPGRSKGKSYAAWEQELNITSRKIEEAKRADPIRVYLTYVTLLKYPTTAHHELFLNNFSPEPTTLPITTIQSRYAAASPLSIKLLIISNSRENGN